MRQQMDNPDDSASLRLARNVAVMLVPQETARMMRENEQRLYWRWHLYGSLEGTMQIPGINALQSLAIHREQLTRGGEPGSEWRHAVFQSEHFSRFGKGLTDIVMAGEVVNRQTLLALAMVLWKKDHNGELPDSLEDLAAYCIINGQQEPARVLPIMALNDPWTGGVFVYSRLWAKSNLIKDGSKPFEPITIIRSAGSTLPRDAAMSVHSGKSAIPDEADFPDMIVYTPDYSMSISIQLQKHTGRLSLVIPATGRR